MDDQFLQSTFLTNKIGVMIQDGLWVRQNCPAGHFEFKGYCTKKYIFLGFIGLHLSLLVGHSESNRTCHVVHYFRVIANDGACDCGCKRDGSSHVDYNISKNVNLFSKYKNHEIKCYHSLTLTDLQYFLVQILRHVVRLIFQLHLVWYSRRNQTEAFVWNDSRISRHCECCRVNLLGVWRQIWRLDELRLSERICEIHSIWNNIREFVLQ